jgi:hypothetical protein
MLDSVSEHEAGAGGSIHIVNVINSKLLRSFVKGLFNYFYLVVKEKKK